MGGFVSFKKGTCVNYGSRHVDRCRVQLGIDDFAHDHGLVIARYCFQYKAAAVPQDAAPPLARL
jgi:hypothetical protein